MGRLAPVITRMRPARVEVGRYLGTNGRAVQMMGGVWVGIANTRVHPAFSEAKGVPMSVLTKPAANANESLESNRRNSNKQERA
jgi:hypothetical protein